jgi:hypothetical protein
LEEDLTLTELMETYERILDNRSNQMEFDARIAGVELKSSASSSRQSSSEESKQPSLVERLKNKKQSDMQAEALKKGSSQYSDGVGYKVI